VAAIVLEEYAASIIRVEVNQFGIRIVKEGWLIVLGGFGGLEVAYWPLVLKFAGSNLAKAVGVFKGEKILSTPSFGGEVKLSVPCRRFAACKRSQNVVEVVISAKLPDNVLAHKFHLLLLGFLASLWTWRHLATKVGMSKGGVK
jgi:hypothetical protein